MLKVVAPFEFEVFLYGVEAACEGNLEGPVQDVEQAAGRQGLPQAVLGRQEAPGFELGWIDANDPFHG